MLKLGIVGHHRTIEIIRKALHQYDPTIDTESIPLDTMDTAPVIAYIKANEQIFDGLLFTGKIPYDLVNTAIFSQKPWVYIRRDSAQLLSVLLAAILVHHYDLTRISIDSYTEAEVMQIFNDLHMPVKTMAHRVFDQSIFSLEFLTALKAFHKSNIDEGHASFCITGISSVYEYLVSQHIPCLILDPTADVIKDTLQQFHLKRQSRMHEKSQIVVLAIERDLPGEHALIRENEYQLSLESMKIAEEIYLFAQRIQAAVIEREIGKYLLFTTRNLFELETDYFQKLHLLSDASTLRFGTLSIGIGYGETAREAKYSANLGLLKAKRSGGNQAYKVQENQYFGPIVPISVINDSTRSHLSNQHQKAAINSGVSVNTILKLQAIMDHEKRTAFTAMELAAAYGISLRSMHRILEKLSKAGFITVIGKSQSDSAGRPSRMVMLDFSI